jgi:hypothetical protein
MIRFVHCVKAQPEIAAADFRRYLHSAEFTELMDQLARLSQASEYKLSLTLHIEANLDLMQERGGAEPFDAIIEIWWNSGQKLAQLTETTAFRDLLQQIEEFQRKFVDFSRSSRFFVEG